MAELPPNIPHKKLLVWATIREALEVSWQHRAVFVPWMVLWAMIAGLNGYNLEGLSGYNLEGGFQYMEVVKRGSGTIGNLQFHVAISFLFSVLHSVVFALFAVLWHRRILLGKNQGLHLRNITFTQRNLDFVLSLVGVSCWIILWLLPSICIWIFITYFWDAIRHLFENEQLVKSILWVFLVDIPCLYLFGRYCLLFPAIAVDFRPIPNWTWPKNVNWVWSQSKESEWQLALLAGGLPALVGWVNTWMFSMVGQENGFLAYSVFSSFLLFAFIPIEVAVLSIAFRELTNWTPPSQLPQPK